MLKIKHFENNDLRIFKKAPVKIFAIFRFCWFLIFEMSDYHSAFLMKLQSETTIILISSLAKDDYKLI